MGEYTIHVPPPCEEDVGVVFADEHLLVLEKPGGLLSVPGRFVKDCVLHRVLFDYPTARIVHRLDLDTSGLLVLALSVRAVSDLNRQFRDRVVHKRYIADVRGVLAAGDSGGLPSNPAWPGVIEAAIAPDPDNRPRQRIDPDGKAALTRFRVLSVDEPDVTGNMMDPARVNRSRKVRTRLELLPETGRSHQLRLHLAHIGHPILGCDLYADEETLGMACRLHLHATGLEFTHPASGDQVSFRSAVPF